MMYNIKKVNLEVQGMSGMFGKLLLMLSGEDFRPVYFSVRR